MSIPSVIILIFSESSGARPAQKSFFLDLLGKIGQNGPMSRSSRTHDLRGIEVRGDSSFRVRINRKGVKRVRTFDHLDEAVAWRDKTMAEIKGEAVNLRRDERQRKARTTSLRSVLERYLAKVTPAKKGAKQEVNRIRMWMRQPWAEMPIASVDQDDIREWRNEQIAAGLAPTTISNPMNCLSAAIRHAKSEWGIETGNPVEGLKRPPQRKGRFVPPDDRLEKLLVEEAAAGSAAWMGPFITIAAWSGMRAGEIAGLRWHKVDLNNHFVHLPETKNEDARDVTLLRKAENAFKRWRTEAGGDRANWVFPSAIERGRRMADNTPTVRFAAIMGRVAERHPDVRRVTFHDLRHWACTRLAPFHRDALHLSRTTGHRHLNTLRRYFNPTAAENAAEIRARASKLAAEAMGTTE